MGLLDVLNGMANGPRGESTPGKGGMSPMTMAILALLAYKAVKHVSGSAPSAAPADAGPATTPASLPGGAAGGGGILGGLLNSLGGGGSSGSTTSSTGGGLGGALGGAGGSLGGLGGMLGGLLAGGAAGSVLSGGLNDLLKQFQDKGHGDAASTWVGSGDNKQIAPDDLANALGADQINTMMAHSGLSRDELLQGLSKQLPDVINHLTPAGRVPTESEASNLL
jgi:uncharacterized protein YidB (DUF937 family)